MAMTEAQAEQLLATAVEMASLIPSLISGYQAIKNGWASSDEADLNAQIVAAHQSIQAMDAQLRALRSAQ